MITFAYTLFLFTYSYVVVAQSPSNDSVEYLFMKPFENGSQPDVVVEFFPSENYYNYTTSNGTVGDRGDLEEKSSKIMKIRPSSVVKKFEQVARIEEPKPKQENSEEAPRWIFNTFHEGLKDFRVRSATNPMCQSQSDLYEKHLQNQTLWAIRIAESTQTEPMGIIGGNSYQMGNFEECIKTSAYGVKGKYCLVNFKYSLFPTNQRKYSSMISDFDFQEMNHEVSVWETLVRLKKDPARVDRQTLFWGFCFPASCSPQDLEVTLNQSLVPYFRDTNVDLNVAVDPVYCHTREPLPFTTGFYITMTFMSMLLLANILSTLYDLHEYLRGRYSHNIDGWREFVGLFSIWRNTYNLGIYNKQSQVKIVNGMKVLMMILIIYGHSLLYIMGYPQFNPASLEEVYRRGADIALVNTNIVDVFFTVSGFLTFYYGYHPMKIGGIVYLILSIIFRYIRLMPVFAVVIAYVIFVLPYTSDGPIWNARIGAEVENCRKNWWLDLLLLNNLIRVDEQCIIISWYITTDMLLCITASVLTFVMIKKPKFGLMLSVLVLLSSMGVTFLITYANNYSGLLKLYMNILANPRKAIEYQKIYVTFYSRAGPYLVGFLTGYLTIKLQERNFKLSKRVLLIGTILAVIIGEGSQYYGIVFYQFERPYNLLENALYACLHRVLFSCLFSWFLLAYLTTGFGIVDSIINHRLFTILGRITYSVFLMNTLSLITLTASIRTPVFFSYKMIMFVVFGDIITTYVLGFLFYLFAEAPICGFSKLLQKLLAKSFEKEIKDATLKAEKSNGITKEKKEISFGA